jgi:hypothetical protein
MLGNNTLIINTATLIQAVQEYLDKRTQGIAVTVKMVKADNQYDGTFRVDIEETPK